MAVPPALATEDGLTVGTPVRYEGLVCAKVEDAEALLLHLTKQGEGANFSRPALCLVGEVSFTPEGLIVKAAAIDTGTVWQVVKVHLLNMDMTGYIITALPLHAGQAV